MSFSPSFSVSQGYVPSTFSVIDTSTGSDGSIVTRHILIQTNTGSYLVTSGTTTDYILFPLSDGSTKTLSNILSQDYCVSITVQWLSVSGTVLYSASGLYLFAQYNQQGLYGAAKAIVQQPNLVQSQNYFNGLTTWWMYVRNAISACDVGGDISGSQEMIDAATNILNNQTYYLS